MSFSIFNPNDEFNKLIEASRVDENVVYELFEDPDNALNTTPTFPITSFTLLENPNNFRISYYSPEEIPINEESLEFDDGTGNNIGNTSLIKLYPTHFEIVCQFSLKLLKDCDITTKLCFEYRPSDTIVLNDFISQIGGNKFEPAGGLINTMIYLYDDQTVIVPTLSYVRPDSTDNILKYCGLIFIQDSSIIEAGKLKDDLLLQMSISLNYIIV